MPVLPRPGLDNASALDALLKAPMTAEVAVRIALMNNPELQEFLGSTGVNLSDVTLKNNPAKSKVREEITLLSAHAYKAWINAVAAAQTARYIQDVKEAAEASGEMARRMAQVGNQSKLMQARAQAELSEAAIQLAKALQLAFSAREELIVTLGLWGEQTEFILPTSLPELPAQALALPHIEAMVLRERMDLALARYEWQLKLAKG